MSRVDQTIAACSIAHNFRLTTVDNELEDFIKQEFLVQTISPLGIIDSQCPLAKIAVTVIIVANTLFVKILNQLNTPLHHHPCLRDV